MLCMYKHCIHGIINISVLVIITDAAMKYKCNKHLLLNQMVGGATINQSRITRTLQTLVSPFLYPCLYHLLLFHLVLY